MLWLYIYIYEACLDSFIYDSNDTNEVQCNGLRSCKLATISKINRLYSWGQNELVSTVISNVKELYIYGEYALINGSIISGGVNNLTVYFYGWMSGNGGTILCDNINDTCNIYCMSKTGCNNLNVECNGTCNV